MQMHKDEKGEYRNMTHRKKIKNVVVMIIAVTNLFANILSPLSTKNVRAEESVSIQKENMTETVKGVAKLGDGPATICVKAKKGEIVQGKIYQLYQLLSAENADNGESINYKINPSCEHALKTVVAEELTRKGQPVTVKEMTEYKVLDYIKSLDKSTGEGENAEQNTQGYRSEFRFFVEKIRNQLSSEKITPKIISATTIKADSSFEITGLDYGYYLLDEVTNVVGADVSASLCMVGTANPDVTVHVKADYPSVIKKIKEDDKFSSPMIEDKNGWNDIGDFEIGQNISYKFVSQIPNISGYESYYYAWHDKMDPALTLCKDSIRVTIQGKDQKDNNKNYTLSEEEVFVDTTPKNEDSFLISVSDMKKIIDREFQKNDSKEENQYGQMVVVTYTAVINEKAADLIGTPAIENDVRLEFSNDPDSINTSSTGYTPWDTVVCYTYTLNIKKMNEKNKFLEGATFRLYSDPECKNEVYVKRGNKGYILINRDQTGGVDNAGGEKPEHAVEMKSDAEGSILIQGIDSGVYYLKETKAPAGYRELKEPIEIKVKAVFSDDRDSYMKGDGAAGKTLKNLDAQAKIKLFYDGNLKVEDKALKTEPSTGKVNLTVINQIGKKLPVTGNSTTLIMVLCGSGLMCYAIIRKKNKK